MVQISEGWTAAAYEQATAFANGADKAISLIGTAADGLGKLMPFYPRQPKGHCCWRDAQAVLVELGKVAGCLQRRRGRELRPRSPQNVQHDCEARSKARSTSSPVWKMPKWAATCQVVYGVGAITCRLMNAYLPQMPPSSGRTP